MQKYKNRKEVPEKYKWDLTDFFKNEDEFNESLKECESLVKELETFIGCTKDKNKLYEFLIKEIKTFALYENLYVYSYLINDQELGNSESIERLNKVITLNAQIENTTSFFAPELLKLDQKTYEELFIQNEKLLGFKDYLDMIYREKAHILTDNEEKIISELTNSMNHFSKIASTLLDSEHNYGTVILEDKTEEVIATNNYGFLMKNKNKNIREHVYNSFNKILDQYGNTSASLLNSYVNMNNTTAKIRHFNSAWEKKLFDQNLTDKVYKSLVNTTESNLKSLHRFYRLKKDVLKLNKLHSYDLNLKMTESKEEYTIEDAQKIIENALRPIGECYLDKFRKIIKNRYIDYCQYKGKTSGGYSFGTLDRPSRILMSFNGDLSSISTIAHEAGHNVNSQFINENNLLQNRGLSPIVAEVASLTNECLLSHYITENATTKEERLAGLENIINVIVSNLFGAVREGKMEQDMYDHVLSGSSLTKDYLDNLTTASLEKYYKKEVELDNYSKNSWIRRHHYYMNFYLYSYAISISVAVNVANKIINQDKDFISKYIEFLKIGTNVWPIDAYKKLDINLEDETVYINAIKYFDTLIDKYYEILDEGK